SIPPTPSITARLHSTPRRLFFQSHGPPRDPHSFPTRRSSDLGLATGGLRPRQPRRRSGARQQRLLFALDPSPNGGWHVTLESPRSEEHTSELQSRGHLVCRLLLEKKNSSRLPLLDTPVISLMS